MRIKVLRSPRLASVDGIDLRRFIPGRTYDVGNRLGALFLSEGWAEPVADEEPALLVPLAGAVSRRKNRRVFAAVARRHAADDREPRAIFATR
ncbi:MAG: hypothetical protein DMF93_19605 [Acidobacteria bacterium]|nr:MAG: hypothetical protein DMF93_19605 [Acidobacteriota bacterium]